MADVSAPHPHKELLERAQLAKDTAPGLTMGVRALLGQLVSALTEAAPEPDYARLHAKALVKTHEARQRAENAEAEVARLTERLTAEVATTDHNNPAIRVLTEQLEAARRREETLRKEASGHISVLANALGEFGFHKPECWLLNNEKDSEPLDPECDCGLTESLEVVQVDWEANAAALATTPEPPPERCPFCDAPLDIGKTADDVTYRGHPFPFCDEWNPEVDGPVAAEPPPAPEPTLPRNVVRLLEDVDEYLCDEPDPADGGSSTVAELRAGIKNALGAPMQEPYRPEGCVCDNPREAGNPGPWGWANDCPVHFDVAAPPSRREDDAR